MQCAYMSPNLQRCYADRNYAQKSSLLLMLYCGVELLAEQNFKLRHVMHVLTWPWHRFPQAAPSDEEGTKRSQAVTTAFLVKQSTQL